jgi:hypothetical protein
MRRRRRQLLVLVVVGAIVRYVVWIAVFIGILLLFIAGFVLSCYLERRDDEQRAARSRRAPMSSTPPFWPATTAASTVNGHPMLPK